MKHILFIIGITILISSCTNYKITSVWKAQLVVPKKYNKILVIGLINEPDRRFKEFMENHFVGDLTSLGYNAVGSLQHYGPKTFENMSEKEALEKINESGIDAVITIVLLEKSKRKLYVRPYSGYQHNYWNYYEQRLLAIRQPGYFAIETKYFWESNLYEMNSKSFLYSVQTNFFSPSSIEAMGHEYGKLIVKNMKKKQVLKQQN